MVFTAIDIIGRTSMWACLSAILLSSGFVDAEKTSENVDRKISTRFEKFHRSKNFPIIADDALENLNRCLNFVTNSSEFQPLRLSIGSHGFRGPILNAVTEYLTRREMDYYRFDFRDFPEWQPNLPPGLTWIIIVDEFENLESQVRGNTRFWRATDKFFIVFGDEKINEPSDSWSSVLKFLWNRHRVSNVIIASTNENFEHLYRYMPFETTNDDFGTVERVDVANPSTNRWIVRNRGFGVTTDVEKSSLLPKFKKIRSTIFEDFRNFNGYPMNVTIFQSLMMNITTNEKNETSYEMLDALVMKLVEERLRSKFRIKVIGLRKNGDPFMNALDGLGRNGDTEIVFTAYFEKLYVGTFSFTSSVFEDKVCLVGPSSEPIPKFFMPILPFSNGLWFLLGLYNVIVAVLWMLLQRIQRTFVRPSEKVIAVPSCVRIEILTKRMTNRRRTNSTFERSPRARPKRSGNADEPRRINPWIVRSFDLLTLASYPLYGGKTWTERAFLFGTLFFGLIFIGLYQSCLVSSLSKPLFYPELNTLSDVAESNRTIITKYRNLLENTFNQGTAMSDRLQKKIQISTSQEKTYDMVVNRGILSIGRFTSFQLENLTEYYNRETHKLLLHMVEECDATYPLSYPVRSDSPYLRRIDSLILRMQQYGFVHKWYGDMLRRAKFEEANRLRGDKNEGVKLTLEHLSLVFLGLGIGIFLSTVVFIVELHWAGKLRRRRLP